uniref:Phenoloxidase n=1 Tax=Nipponaphis monzeni TaxID=196483 RepID=A0A481MQH0_9HEMI
MTDRNNILYLFHRPTEPIFLNKGNDNVTFEIPPEYLTDRYKTLASDLRTQFPGGKSVPVIKLKNLPDISFPMSLSRSAPFSLFNKHHSKMASKLIEILMAPKIFDNFLSLSVYCRDRINPYMFNYALSVAVIHRSDTRDITLPSHAEIFPNLYMDSSVFSRAREEAIVVQPGSRVPIVIPHDFTASDLDPEQRLSYFREEIGINLHYWHWRLIYPSGGPFAIVNKDRRGELFYYMHQQILARYNMERLCNNMSRVAKLADWRAPIAEGYFPKLDSVLANRVWSPRPVNATLKNINRESDQMSFGIEDLERWRDIIYNAINSGFVKNNDGEEIKLTVGEGIDILGNLVEASDLSLNSSMYGSLHNYGHYAISCINDPDNRFQDNYGVMADAATAMRDPIFYRWHAYIDEIFQEYKATLPAYTVENLTFENIRIHSFNVSTPPAAGLPSPPRNEISTFWLQNDVELSKGLDFIPRGSVFARFTHLQHLPYNYNLTVENSGNQRVGTIRTFIAPKFDERGVQFSFREQRKLFVELDKFSVTLKKGINDIVRRCLDSSVSIPIEMTYRNLDESRPEANAESKASLNYCGCGWPQYMLVAKGNAQGFPCHLFIMITYGAMDQVEETSKEGEKTCDNVSVFCGVRNARYPDSKPMGYPFDRPARDGVATVQEFLTPNMTVQDVKIRHNDITVPQFHRQQKPAKH